MLPKSHPRICPAFKEAEIETVPPKEALAWSERFFLEAS